MFEKNFSECVSLTIKALSGVFSFVCLNKETEDVIALDEDHVTQHQRVFLSIGDLFMSFVCVVM